MLNLVPLLDELIQESGDPSPTLHLFAALSTIDCDEYDYFWGLRVNNPEYNTTSRIVYTTNIIAFMASIYSDVYPVRLRYPRLRIEVCEFVTKTTGITDEDLLPENFLSAEDQAAWATTYDVSEAEGAC